MNVKEQFKNIFGYDASHVYFAPGRVNLIGEHVDYNGGMVLPCALTIGTYGVISLREDDKIRLYSENFKDEGSCTVRNVVSRKKQLIPKFMMTLQQ